MKRRIFLALLAASCLAASAHAQDRIVPGKAPAQVGSSLAVTCVDPVSGAANACGSSAPAVPFSGKYTLTASAAAISGGTWNPSAPTSMTNGIVCKALSTNTGTIYIGGSGVSSSNGYALAAGEAISFGPTSTANIYAVDSVTTDVLVCVGS
jgi:hypothetical protein